MKQAHIDWKLITLFILVALLCLIAENSAYAGGPRWIAGSSYFNPSAKGKPVVWANGQVGYFTDMGSLSSTVTQAQANTMVTNAAAVWNAVTTAGVKIIFKGDLSEDVNGTNVTSTAGVITEPVDIRSTATTKPVDHRRQPHRCGQHRTRRDDHQWTLCDEYRPACDSAVSACPGLRAYSRA
jgi:hypothetical protein